MLSLRRFGNLCGILGPCLWAFAVVYCGSLRPDYSHVSQYISELGEQGSSTEVLMRYLGFVPTGIMHMLFAAFLMVTFRRSRWAVIGAVLLALNGAGRIGAGIFPCDPGCTAAFPSLSQDLHGMFARLGFLSMVGAALVWGLVVRRFPRLHPLSAYSIASAVGGFAALAAMTLGARGGVGTYESLASGILSLWLLVFALRLWSSDGRELARESGRAGNVRS